MNRGVERIPITAIVVGDRRREEMGDIAGLAESIMHWGLLHPLTVDQDNRLVAGERRLAALQQLGYEEVEVRRWNDLTPDERELLELEENEQRKDLTAHERSKNRVRRAEVAAKIDMETGEIRDEDLFTESVNKSGPGRPKGSKKLGTLERVSERTGLPVMTIHDAQRHVAAAEDYPFLKQAGWNQSNALEAAAILNAMPEDDRLPVAALIDQPGIPPQVALPALRNLAAKPAVERREILALARSHDSREQTLALTKAAAMPPMPDPRRALLADAVTALVRAVRLFPADPEVPHMQAIIAEISEMSEAIKERTRHDKHAAD